MIRAFLQRMRATLRRALASLLDAEADVMASMPVESADEMVLLTADIDRLRDTADLLRALADHPSVPGDTEQKRARCDPGP